MHTIRIAALTALTIATTTACSTPKVNAPSGEAAYALMPPPPEKPILREYFIQPADKLTVVVFQEPDLSVQDIAVDTAGRVAMPLLGQVPAVGLSSDQLAANIQKTLALHYLKEPRVTVYVSSQALQHVIVDGSVSQPGVYDLRGQTTLLGAIAMARGSSRVAANDQVAVFRRINGQLSAAKFNVDEIRLGLAADPEILPNDTVVVGFSGLKSAWRDFLQAIPAVALFRPLYD